MANTNLPISEMQNAAALTAQNLTFEKARILEQVGAIKMAAITRRFVSVTEIEMLADIKQSKQYKDLPMVINGESVFVTTWEQFCNAIGSSVETIDNNIRNYQRMGGEFFEYAQNAGIPQRTLAQIGRLPAADREMVIEMAQKEETTKDAVLQVLEQIMAKHAAEKEQAAAEKAELESRVQDLQETASAKDEVISQKNKKVDELAEKLAKKQGSAEEPKPEDVGSELVFRMESIAVGARSDISRFAELFEQLEAHGQAHGFNFQPTMAGCLNQIMMDVQRLRDRFGLPATVPDGEEPEWLKEE
ncbi:hypothetical protein [Neisseria shayeganii]|uniref:Phage protein n=1 Tax=Neisseria shayeganii 871 TaxID=1032488 RepID=G4CJI0_9NEIS|nr:hypothetical protein [Neisseria shayeganii]EGY52031.1 hypothetical protein HMPREF9371_1770 [Neisseria shayeganii 871]